MKVWARTTEKLIGHPTPDGWDVLEVTSDTEDKVYRIDITHGRCSCPGWKFQRGFKYPCRHLKALGFMPVFEAEVAEPQKQKAGTPVEVKVHYSK